LLVNLRFIVFAVLFLLGVMPIWADENLSVLKAGNDVYTNVTVTTVTATDIYFTYNNGKGMANAKLKSLDFDLQKHFHYNATNAAAVEQEQVAANAQYRSQAANRPIVSPPDETRYPSSPPPPELQTGKKIWANSFLNQKAPDLIVEKWLTPEPDCNGKFVLIDFWATWCPPCREAIPELNRYAKEFGDKLVVIGISNEQEDVVKNFHNPQIEYSVAVDTQARTKKAVGVTGIPHVLILDPQGIVRWEGYPFLSGYELNDKVIADIIAKYSN
jgi:cytochrome c biogenesis protein CcmG, thiol:disulfide interchange protein DsbE